MLRAVTSLVAPPLCALCGRPCDRSDPICRACERRVSELAATRIVLPSGLEVISAAPYQGVARELVRRMKFAARLNLAQVAAERMVRAWGATRAGGLVPVPPAPARARARGYDTAYALARLVQRSTRARIRPVLARADGPRQVGRPRSQRLADPPAITRVNPSIELPDELWLVDDVVTTGATLDACAAALHAAGSSTVRALTFARADSLGPAALAA